MSVTTADSTGECANQCATPCARMMRAPAERVARRGFIARLLALGSWQLFAPPVVAAGQSLVVAKASELAAPWSAVHFKYAVDADTMPGIVIRLPDRSLYAASLICPHQKCSMAYNKNAQEVSDSYDVQVKGPVIACPCHLSVFDLEQNGKVVSGPASRPPYRFDVNVVGDDVIVERLSAES